MYYLAVSLAKTGPGKWLAAAHKGLGEVNVLAGWTSTWWPTTANVGFTYMVIHGQATFCGSAVVEPCSECPLGFGM